METNNTKKDHVLPEAESVVISEQRAQRVVVGDAGVERDINLAYDREGQRVRPMSLRDLMKNERFQEALHNTDKL